jgi:hypothetical protein
MAKDFQDHIAAGLSAFTKNVEALRRIKNLENDSELWRVMTKKVADAPSRKTVNNALVGRHDAQISTLQAVADTLDCPLWVLFIPNLLDTDLQSPNRERLIALMHSYLQCDNDSRHHVENMATAFAAKPKK